MKKAKRILALVLALVMAATGCCITTFAQVYDYSTPTQDTRPYAPYGKVYFTPEQAGSWLMDTIDDLLLTSINNGENDEDTIDLSILMTWGLHGRSLDEFAASIADLFSRNLVSIGKNLLGDLDRINASAFDNYKVRNTVGRADFECIIDVIKFLDDNQDVLRDIVNGSFNYGTILKLVFQNIDPILGGDSLYDDLQNLDEGIASFLPGVLNKIELEYNEQTASAGIAESERNVDNMIQKLVNAIVGLYFPSLDPTTQCNINTTPFYDVVHNLIEGAITDLAVPLLTDVLVDAFDIRVSPEYPNGNPADMNNETFQMVLGIVENLGDYLSETVIDPPVYSAEAEIYPVLKIKELLHWAFFSGVLDNFIIINEAGIGIGDGLIDLLNNAAPLLAPLVYNLDEDYQVFAKDQVPGLAEGNWETDQTVAGILKVFLSSIIDGFYCPLQADSIAEVGAYALASLCADILPDINYFDRLDANYGLTNATPLPFVSNYTASVLVNGEATNRTYKVPLACIEIGTKLGKYYLAGLMNANFDAVTGEGMTAFEQFVKVLADWGLENYLPIFKKTYETATNYPNPGDVWKELDKVLFSLIPASWMPESITIHEVNENGSLANKDRTIPRVFTMDCTLDIIFNWLLGSVMNFDLQGLFGIFSRNNTANAELKQPIVPVLLRIVDRVLFVVFGNYAILPPNQGYKKNGKRDAFFTPTSLDHLSGSTGLINKNNLGNFIKYLSDALYDQARDILSTVLPLVMGLKYVDQYRDYNLDHATGRLVPGEITVDKLEAYVEDLRNWNKVVIPYTPVKVDAVTVGDFYTGSLKFDENTGKIVFDLDKDENNQIKLTHLDGRGNDTTKTYYTQTYVKAAVDRFTVAPSNTYYTLTESYSTVTLPDAYDSSRTYYSTTEYTDVTANVNETTNGKFFAGSDHTEVTLPDSYDPNATYYLPTQVSVNAESTGTYRVKNSTYTPCGAFTGTAGAANFVENKDVYKIGETKLSIDYTDALVNIGSNKTFVIGRVDECEYGKDNITYHTGIEGKMFYICFEDEDFPNRVYSYNKFEDYLDEAEDFVGDYKEFVYKTVPACATEWRQYLAGGTDKMPDCMYPYYDANGNYGTDPRIGALYGMNDSSWNNLQGIQDVLNLFGVNGLVASNCTNIYKDGDNNSTKPWGSRNQVPSAEGSGNTDLEIQLYKSWKEYTEDMYKYSANLNNYYDCITKYIEDCEGNRTSTQNVNLTNLNWVVNKYEESYHNGSNIYINANQQEAKYYTTKSWAKFKAAYEAALALQAQVQRGITSQPVTQSLVSKVRQGLMSAYMGLVQSGMLADYTQLLEYVAEAGQIVDDSEYTDTFTQETRTALENAITIAASVPQDCESDEQDLIDDAAQALYRAMNALGYVDPPEVLGGEDTNTSIYNTIAGVTYGYIGGLTEGTGLTYDPNSNNNPVDIQGVNKKNVTLNGTPYGYGTGAFLKAESGANTLFRYYAVVFGDVNGDARIDATDMLIIQAYQLLYGTSAVDSVMNSYELLAADVNGDGTISAVDAQDIQKVFTYKGTIDQSGAVETPVNRFVAAQ